MACLTVGWGGFVRASEGVRVYLSTLCEGTPGVLRGRGGGWRVECGECGVWCVVCGLGGVVFPARPMDGPAFRASSPSWCALSCALPLRSLPIAPLA